MNRLSSHLRGIGLLFLFLTSLTWMAVTLAYSDNSELAAASPPAQATPTCPPNGCDQARVYGYQPRRYDMRSTFNDAASNALGNNGPPYDRINRGLPPSMIQEPVTASRPIPHIALRGMAWQESHWLQFADSIDDSDSTYACTLMSSAGDCGFGLMQITSCMSNNDNDCGWFTRSRVAGRRAQPFH